MNLSGRVISQSLRPQWDSAEWLQPCTHTVDPLRDKQTTGVKSQTPNIIRPSAFKQQGFSTVQYITWTPFIVPAKFSPGAKGGIDYAHVNSIFPPVVQSIRILVSLGWV